MNASPLALSFVIVAIGFATGVIPFFFRWTHTTAHRWIALGGGTMLGAAFLHMLPEGYELAGASTSMAAVAGFVLLYLVEQFSFRHPHDEDAGEFHELGFLAFLGLALHDLIDGIALGSGHHVGEVSSAIFLALVLHKIPTTFALSLMLLHGGWRRRKVLLFLTALLMAIPLGALISSFLTDAVGGNPETTLGRLIGFSAGTFIYIGAYELLPEMQRKSDRGPSIALFFLAGIAVTVLLTFIH